MIRKIISLGMALLMAVMPFFGRGEVTEREENSLPLYWDINLTEKEDEEESQDESLTQRDEERFGFDTRAEWDEEGRLISVNGYPAFPVRAGIDIRDMEETFQYETDFLEYPFWKSATEYDGNLATMSLALALSAERPLEPKKGFDPSLNLEKFLTDAGFTDLRKDDYYRETSMYTVSTAIGFRRMKAEGHDPFTLIAVGVCGGNYDNEWQSNMTPGEGPYHQGFLEAAQLVIDRIAGYILTRGITGRVKIWISGYSRAAAISNLTAGLLVKEGVWPKEDIFAYTFATPAAVLNPPESGYENIFNILSPMDLVPVVMPAEWGFGRFGKDLFLPTTEFSSIGRMLTAFRGAMSKTTFGVDTLYSPALNLRMRLLYSMTLNLIGDRENYNTRFQPAVVGVMQNLQASNLLTRMRELLLTMKGADAEKRKCLDGLMDYVVRVGSNALTRTELGAANRNSGDAAIRLFNEHREDNYLASEELMRLQMYEREDAFSYVMIRGPVRVKLTLEGVEDYSVTLTENGEIEYSETARKEWESLGDPTGLDHVYYMERIGQTSILAVENDLNYQADWEAVNNGQAEIRVARCYARARSDYPGYRQIPFSVKKGDGGIAFRNEWSRSETVPEGFIKSTMTAEEMATFLGIASTGVQWRPGMMLFFLMIGLILALSLRLMLSARKRSQKPTKLFWFFFAIYCASALETEAAYWIFADLPWIRMMWKGVLGASLIVLFLVWHRCWDEIRKAGVLPGLIVAIMGDILISDWFLPGAGLLLICHVLLIRSFLKRKGMRKGKWIQWAIASAMISGIILAFFAGRWSVQAWAAAVSLPVVLLMAYSAGEQPIRVRYATGSLLISDMLMGLYATLLKEPVAHMGYVTLFYAGLLLLAMYKEEAPSSGTET